MNKFIKIISFVALVLFSQAWLALSADQVYFYYTDPAGTPLAMSDASGTVVWRADYMPFGEESIDLATVQNNKMFVGKEKDSESGLYYFGARYMDAGVGRFASADSIGPVNPKTGRINDKQVLDPQRLNVYAYAKNNPYAYIDPDGNELVKISLPGLNRSDPMLRMRSYMVDSKIALAVTFFVDEARNQFPQLSVNNIYRVEDSSTINTDNTTANGLSRHQAGTAIDLNGVGTLNAMELEKLNSIAAKYKLAPISNQGNDLPHFDIDPKKLGYESLKDAVDVNRQDYIMKKTMFPIIWN